MNVIDFIKRNISLLNTVSIIIIVCLLFEFITMSSEDSYHGMASAILFGFLIVSLLLLLIDYVLRLIFKDKMILFLIEFVLLISVIYLIYSNYFS